MAKSKTPTKRPAAKKPAGPNRAQLAQAFGDIADALEALHGLQDSNTQAKLAKAIASARALRPAE